MHVMLCITAPFSALCLLDELLPLDDTRRAEITVFLEFATAARTDPALDHLAREAAAGTRTLVRRIFIRKHRGGGLRPDLASDVEAARLWALLDGLSFNAVLQSDLVSAHDCVAALRAHLDELEPAGTRTGS